MENEIENLPKVIKQIGIVGDMFHMGTVYHIISEPGDMTQYDYIAHQSDSIFNFMPRKSTFEFPSRLDFWEIHEFEWEDVIKLGNKIHCNPSTVMECIRTMKELYKP